MDQPKYLLNIQWISMDWDWQNHLTLLWGVIKVCALLLKVLALRLRGNLGVPLSLLVCYSPLLQFTKWSISIFSLCLFSSAMKRSIDDPVTVALSAYSAATTTAKPVFLTKAQHEQLALQLGQEEIAEQRRWQELLLSRNCPFDSVTESRFFVFLLFCWENSPGMGIMQWFNWIWGD